MKDDRYINNPANCAKIRLCVIGCLTQIYGALYGDAMLVPIQRGG